MNIIKQAISPFGQILAATAIFALILSSFAYAVPAFAEHGDNGPYGDEVTNKVEICHWNSSGGGSYNSTEPNVSSILSESKGNHGSHGEDIIPPFHYEDGEEIKTFPGRNWDQWDDAPVGYEGLDPQDIYNTEDCALTPDQNPTTGTITIEKTVVNDGGGEASVSDFTFYVNGTEVDEGVATTVPTGEHAVSEDPLAGYTAGKWGEDCESDGSITVEADTDYTCTITNMYDVPADLGSISGTKYDQGENKLPGWTIFIDGNDNGQFDNGEVSTTTDQNGEYTFTDLADGTYDVCEVQQNGWTQQTPATSTNNGCHEVEVSDGSDETGVDFWNEQDEDFVNYCDPSQKPGGMSIGEWLAEGEANGADCFDYEVEQSCGMLDVAFTENQTPYDYSFRYVIGTTTPDLVDWEGDGELPVNFSEDEHGGSVDVTYYVVGPEEDYFVGFGIPNIWDGNGETVTVDTNCESDEPTPEPVCKVGENLLSNGSFEDPVVTDNDGDWETTSITDWVITKVSDGTSTLGELWRNFMGGASHLEQNVELGADEKTQLAQATTTIPGATYELRFDFSPRPGYGLDDNSVDALVDGTQLMNASGDGTLLATTSWSTHSQIFVAGSSTTEIAFADAGVEDNSTGSLIDNAVLCLVDEPEEEEFSCSISASQNPVEEGSNFNLNWSTTGGVANALSASISGIGEVATTGATSTSIASDTTFTLTVFDAEMLATTTCDVTVKIETDDGGGGSSGGGGGEMIELTENGGGGERVELTEDGDEPEPEVLGEQVSAVPAVAPATGAGGAADTNPLASAVALIGMLLSLGALRVTRNG